MASPSPPLTSRDPYKTGPASLRAILGLGERRLRDVLTVQWRQTGLAAVISATFSFSQL